MISGDDRVMPIIGYSTSSSFDTANVPPALQKMIEGYKNQIRFAIENDLLVTAAIEDKWNDFLNNKLDESVGTDVVAPLLSTKWNQSPYYNDQCPFDNTYSEHTVTGCTATAMAQIMKFWNYPAHGTGFHSYNCPDYGTQTANFAATTYNWAAMPNIVNSPNNSVATIMYQCGVSVDMNYGVAATGGSGAAVIYNNGQSPACAEVAYKTYFGYNPNTIQGLKRVNYTETAWINLLKTDLNSGRPIQYVGWGTSGGGHTFVCDGFDANSFFHMNWGWGGSSDAYFNLNALNPGTYNFNNGQQAVIGIQPLSGGGSTPNIKLNSSISITPNPINFYQSFTVNADLTNAGTTSFSGDYCAALFDSDGIFIDYVQTLTTGANPLPPGYHYTGGLTFSNGGLPTVPGNYLIGIYYRVIGGEWILASSTTYPNIVTTHIKSPYNPLEQYSDIVVNPKTLVQGASATVNVNFYNKKLNTYYGQYKAALYDLEGNFVQTIGTCNESNGLPSGHFYNSPYITFSCPSITASPGTYMLAILEKENGSADTYFVGGTYYQTPINIVVVAPVISPDIFESYDDRGE